MQLPELAEISPGKFKPAVICTPRERKRASRIGAEKIQLTNRCIALLDELPRPADTAALDDLLERLPSLIREMMATGEFSPTTTLPELREAVQALERVCQDS